MRKRKVKILLVIILLCLGILPIQIQNKDSSSNDQRGRQIPIPSQEEQLIFESTAGTGCLHWLCYGVILQVFEYSNQSGYYYRLHHIIDYSIDKYLAYTEMNLTQREIFTWHFANQVFLDYRTYNVTIWKEGSDITNTNYTFSTPVSIEGVQSEIRSSIGYITRINYDRDRQDLSNPEIVVPNLNQFTYYITVLGDNLSYRIQKDVVWTNTSMAAIFGKWTMTTLTSDENFDQYIAEFEVRSYQYLFVHQGHASGGTGGFIQLNQTSSTIEYQNLFLYDWNHTYFELYGIYETYSSNEIQHSETRDILIISGDNIRYEEAFMIDFVADSYNLDIDFHLAVKQKSPAVRPSSSLLWIYIVSSFVGGVGVSILGVVIWAHYHKKRSIGTMRSSTESMKEQKDQ